MLGYLLIITVSSLLFGLLIGYFLFSYLRRRRLLKKIDRVIKDAEETLGDWKRDVNDPHGRTTRMQPDTIIMLSSEMVEKGLGEMPALYLRSLESYNPPEKGSSNEFDMYLLQARSYFLWSEREEGSKKKELIEKGLRSCKMMDGLKLIEKDGHRRIDKEVVTKHLKTDLDIFNGVVR